ncbi:MAG: MFS transporter [Pirellulales bacterium]|nr:MFS transporter [Pirellulales bacterium]
MNAADAQPVRLTTVHWLILIIASIGFAFDIYELLMLPLIASSALSELLGVPLGDKSITTWIGNLAWGSAMVGGAIGLVGGWLTDRLGRRRVLTWSILIYATSAFASGFAQSVESLFVLRCLTFAGVCVEFVAAIAWLAELFPNPRQRETILGFTQAFSSLGGLLAAGIYGLIVVNSDRLPAIYGAHAPWRYMLMSGLLPALPLIVIRPFLPESPAWQAKRAAGQLRRPSFAELFAPGLRRTTIVTTILFACCYGAAFGAIQLGPTQILPGLPEMTAARTAQDEAKKQVAGMQAMIDQASADDPAGKAQMVDALKQLRKQVGAKGKPIEAARSRLQTFQEMGGLVGRFVLAVAALIIVSRRSLLQLFLVPGLILLPLVFVYPATRSLPQFEWGLAAVALCTVAQFSFWGNYLPRVFPLHLRGTGESFAANVGGRMIGTSASLITTRLAQVMPGDSQFTKVAYAAAAVGTFVYALALVVSFFLPEPHEKDLAD